MGSTYNMVYDDDRKMPVFFDFGRTLALDGRAGCRPADEPQWWSATWPRARRGTRLPGRAASAIGALLPYIRLDAESDADVRLATPAAAPWPAIVAL